MSPTVTLKGTVKVAFKRLVSGAELGSSTFTGPGELLLAHTIGEYVEISDDELENANAEKSLVVSVTITSR